MLIGDASKFAVYVEKVEEWALDNNNFHNGILFFIINNKIFPNEIYTATYGNDIGEINRSLQKIVINTEIYDMDKNSAFLKLYETAFASRLFDNPEEIDLIEDDRYIISRSSILCQNGYAFLAMGNGSHTKILAAWVETTYDDILEENIFHYDTAEVTEAVLTNGELKSITGKLALFITDPWSFF